MTANQLMQYVPPELRYERVPLAEGANALGPWTEAIGKFQKLEVDSDGLSSLFYGNCEGETPSTPTEKDWRRLADWIAANEPALTMLDQGIARGNLQLPRRTWEPLELVSEVALAFDVVELRELGRLLRLRMQLALGRGDDDAAAADVVRHLQMADLVLRGEGAILDLIIGNTIRSSALDGVCETASGGNLSAAAKQEIVATLESSIDVNAACRSAHRVELGEYALSTLAKLPETNDASQLIDSMLSIFYVSADSYKASQTALNEETPDEAVLQRRVEQRRQLLTSLLNGHPRLLDKRATVQAMGELTIDAIRALDRPPDAPIGWTARITERFRRRLRPTSDELLEKAWPDVLHPSFPFEAFGDDHAAVAERADMAHYWPAAMPTDRQIATCRALLRRVDNPIGRTVARILVGVGTPETLTETSRETMNAARSALELRSA